MRDALARGHHVHAVPEPIDEIDIRMARWPEHDFVALSTTSGRMCREIFGTHIRFGLDDATDSLVSTDIVDEAQTEQLACDEEGVFASIERAGNFFGHVA